MGTPHTCAQQHAAGFRVQSSHTSGRKRHMPQLMHWGQVLAFSTRRSTESSCVTCLTAHGLHRNKTAVLCAAAWPHLEVVGPHEQVSNASTHHPHDPIIKCGRAAAGCSGFHLGLYQTRQAGDLSDQQQAAGRSKAGQRTAENIRAKEKQECSCQLVAGSQAARLRRRPLAAAGAQDLCLRPGDSIAHALSVAAAASAAAPAGGAPGCLYPGLQCCFERGMQPICCGSTHTTPAAVCSSPLVQ